MSIRKKNSQQLNDQQNPIRVWWWSHTWRALHGMGMPKKGRFGLALFSLQWMQAFADWHVGPGASWCDLAQQLSRNGSNVSCKKRQLVHGQINMSICLHPRGDYVSDQTRKHVLWVDCVEILSLWWSSQAERAEASKTRTFQSHMFLDIGANLGLCSFTILASDPEASVTMFEPVVHNQKQIAESLCRNPGWARRAVLFLGALSSERASSPLAGTAENFGVSRLGSPDTWASKRMKFIDLGVVETHRLDDIWSGLGGARVTKIDVEGAEYRILLGAQRLLHSGAMPLIHFEYSPAMMQATGSQPVQLLQPLHDLEYDFYWCATDFLEQTFTDCGLFSNSVPLDDQDLSILAHCGGLQVQENFIAIQRSSSFRNRGVIQDYCSECFLPKFLTLHMCFQLRASVDHFVWQPTWFQTCCLTTACGST